MRGVDAGRVHLSALVVQPDSWPAPALGTDTGTLDGVPVVHWYGHHAIRYDFSLPMHRQASYWLDGAPYEVNTAFSGDLRLAYVSCNGQERGDLSRPRDERNVMWRRLRQRHSERPFNLLLHGGDQIYADEILNVHPATRAWVKASRAGKIASAEAGADGVEEALRHALFQRYLELYAHSDFAWLSARVPALAMWDDHDICDGWGSLPTAKLESDIGRAVFRVAREQFLLFQLGTGPDSRPESGFDANGVGLGWHLALPDLHILAPDLRSERQPRRVMGPQGWAGFRTAAASIRRGKVLVISSVPALGPRLSWVEGLMALLPTMQKYEDDLRDQWQSRAHRAEWQDFLRVLLDIHLRPDCSVTILSGEIHLATRATLAADDEPLQQLVASGITHPPPPQLYARALGALARLGSAPLPDHPIRLHPLPGKSAIYTAERNYLVLERQQGEWCAWWDLERSGPTPPLSLA